MRSSALIIPPSFLLLISSHTSSFMYVYITDSDCCHPVRYHSTFLHCFCYIFASGNRMSSVRRTIRSFPQAEEAQAPLDLDLVWEGLVLCP
ncbi:uncharacterized protein SCHCODRAFT_02104291 [Schizophyllum commune H4-8]|uniref:uncharacterized protein n=1 Tax=Schizophyllum commune (strain H4-8 / FGSC 9210) TaxID=578458 RepID=UPI0021609E13|nr:uncharacterized protein SCHCODRAFT_02104291 [Schizophyllum commune H4-8]KAI5886676.1 hypothetical protein SCHCODRAFT_02104291 [Schizophyllum commune H4-8]